MKVVRQIVYESESQEALDRQLFNSAGDGMKQFFKSYDDKPLTVGVTITVRTLLDERVKVDEFPEETAKAVGAEYKHMPDAADYSMLCQCANCVKVRTRRELLASERIELESQGIDASMDDEQPTPERPEYRPTLFDESETTQGAN